MIEFVYPQVIPLMLIPSLILFIVLFTRKGRVLSDFSDDVLEKLEMVKGNFLSRKARLITIFFALFLMIIALSRPVINHGEKEIVTKGSEFVAIIDISRSMLAKDLYPNRLEFAKKKLKKFISHTRGDKVGVIGFAGGSFLVSPLTEDRDSLSYLIDSLDSERISVGGSDLLSAVEAADEMMKDKKRAVVIFSDGGEGEFSEVIDFANKKNLKVFAVGIGSQKGAPIPDINGGFIKEKGNIVVTSLNENLKTLGLKSGGGYIEGSFGDSDMEKLYSAITGVLESKTHEKKKIEDFTELFYYPIALALVFLLIGFHSLPKRSLALFLLLFTFNEKSYALSYDFTTMETAQKLYNEGKYKEAEELFSKIEDPSTSQKAKIDYNIGNSKFRENDFEGAIKAYEESLKNSPNDADAKHNLEVAKKRLEEKKKEEKQKKKQDQKEGKDKKESNKDSKEQDQNNQDKEKSQQEKDKNSKQKEDEKKKSQEEKDKEAKKKEDEKNKSQEDKKAQEEKPSDEKLGEKNQENFKKVEKEQKERDLKNRHWLKKLEDIKNPIPLKQLKKSEGNSNDKPW